MQEAQPRRELNLVESTKMPLSQRDNNEWQRALSLEGPEGDAARSDLRAILVASLRKMLASRRVAEDLAEDFAQEAVLRVCDRLPSFRGESRFTTWALCIATRIAFDELRHRRWKDVSLESLTATSQTPVAFELRTEASQEDATLRARVLGVLREVIDSKLTARQRGVLSAELEGVPHSEIATRLGVTRNALYKLGHDARRRVKAHFEAAGLSEAEVLCVFK
jgi:RNA polymerase sigma-70 factor (ECF subfamily)